ncbi:MAG: hypothetical protein AAF557_20605 [Pseudomonadota bacterium]
MPRMFCAAILSTVLLSSACATVSPEPASVIAVQYGEVVAAEQVASSNTQGANSVVRVGSAILGVLVPGPWGGVAGTAGGEAGRAVLPSTGGQWRYFVRLPDGTIRTIEQADGPALRKGAKVDVIEMSDGSARVVASTVPGSAATG